MLINDHFDSSRVYCREYQFDDFSAVHVYASIPAVSQFEEWGPNSKIETYSFINNAIKISFENPRKTYEMAVILRATDELIGGARIAIDSEDTSVGDIGYVISPHFQNIGLATEVAKKLIQFGFKELNLQLIYATCHTENIASYKVMEKCGMQRVKVNSKDRTINGQKYDSYRYEIHSI